MPIIISRKKSMIIGLGLLGLFFVTSFTIIWVNNSSRIPTTSTTLTKESIEGPPLAVSTENPTQGNSAVGFVLNDFHRSATKDGKIIWEVFGKKGRYDPARNQATVDEPDVTVNQENGDTVKVKAGKADLTLTGSDLLKADLYEHVVAVYQNETTMRAERAVYIKASNSVEIPVPVEVEGPLFSIKGKNLKANIETQEFVMTDGVRSTFKPRQK